MFPTFLAIPMISPEHHLLPIEIFTIFLISQTFFASLFWYTTLPMPMFFSSNIQSFYSFIPWGMSDKRSGRKIGATTSKTFTCRFMFRRNLSFYESHTVIIPYFKQELHSHLHSKDAKGRCSRYSLP